jgi:hypothetical protein
MTTTPASTSYRDQIRRCVRAMERGRAEDVRPFVDSSETISRIQLFIGDNLNKRFDKVRDQVELLARVFDNLDDLIEQYIQEVPLAAYDTGCLDGDRFLNWLRESRTTTLEQQDFIRCQQARHEIERLARRQRAAHLHFQDLHSLPANVDGGLRDTARSRVYLNPIHTWTTFQTTALLDEDSDVPADVLFFAAGTQIRTTVFDDHGLQLIRLLESHPPLTMQDWKKLVPKTSRRKLTEFSRDAIELGLVAFG